MACWCASWYPSKLKLVVLSHTALLRLASRRHERIIFHGIGAHYETTSNVTNSLVVSSKYERFSLLSVSICVKSVGKQEQSRQRTERVPKQKVIGGPNKCNVAKELHAAFQANSRTSSNRG